MKKFSFCLLVFVLLFSFLSVHAADAHLIDDADLLTEYGEELVTKKLDALSAKYGIDVVIVTADTLNGKTPMDYADDYYDYHDYAPDGVLLLVSMEDRDWWISTSGSCIQSVSSRSIQYIGDQFVSYLTDGEYGEGMLAFADEIDNCLTAQSNSEVYPPREPFGWTRVGVCAVIAFIFGLIVINAMKKKMNSVAYQRAAAQYVRPGSMNVTLAQDFFLYRTISRVARPKESSSSGGGSHTSSSGSSHGGGGGKF